MVSVWTSPRPKSSEQHLDNDDGKPLNTSFLHTPQ